MVHCTDLGKGDRYIDVFCTLFYSLFQLKNFQLRHSPVLDDRTMRSHGTTSFNLFQNVFSALYCTCYLSEQGINTKDCDGFYPPHILSFFCVA